MMRQTVLLTLQDIPYFCYPESVGHYMDHVQHAVLREAGALNNFNIHYVASGKGYVEVDGVVHELRAGQAFLYFPQQRQHYYSSEDDPWDVRWVHFYGERLHDYMIERGCIAIYCGHCGNAALGKRLIWPCSLKPNRTRCFVRLSYPH